MHRKKICSQLSLWMVNFVFVLAPFDSNLFYVYLCGSVFGIRIRFHESCWIRIQFGSGSTTLALTGVIQNTIADQSNENQKRCSYDCFFLCNCWMCIFTWFLSFFVPTVILLFQRYVIARSKWYSENVFRL